MSKKDALKSEIVYQSGAANAAFAVVGACVLLVIGMGLLAAGALSAITLATRAGLVPAAYAVATKGGSVAQDAGVLVLGLAVGVVWSKSAASMVIDLVRPKSVFEGKITKLERRPGVKFASSWVWLGDESFEVGSDVLKKLHPGQLICIHYGPLERTVYRIDGR